MELLDQSLNDLFKSKNKKFSLKTTCMLGIQMIDRIEYIIYSYSKSNLCKFKT